MAGSQDPSDNPVAVNVVPLVDVIFCLCVFFMCSFKFRQLEGKLDAWLPKDQGVPDKADSPVPLPTEMRVAVLWDEPTKKITRLFGKRTVADDDELERVIDEARRAWSDKGHPEAPLTIDADAAAPWNEIASIVNLAKRRGVANVEFALGRRPTRTGR